MNASLSVLVVSVLLIRSVAGADEPGTNLVSIYLVDRPNAQPCPRLDTASLKDLKLVAPPVRKEMKSEPNQTASGNGPMWSWLPTMRERSRRIDCGGTEVG
jgi:hypothetical protein